MFKYPRILCVDGLDGTGKATVTAHLSEYLRTQFGAKVVFIGSPFYDSNSGQMVSEYLHKGYGDMRDRRLISSLYTADRNWHLRDNFGRIFDSGDVDYIIMNRWHLTSFLFNTTMVLQGDAEKDAARTRTPYMIGEHKLPMRTTTSFDFYGNHGSHYIRTLRELHQMFGTISAPPDHLRVEPDDVKTVYPPMSQLYYKARIALLRETANMLYSMEVLPWVHVDPNGEAHLPFAHVETIVLVTGDRTENIVQDNLSKRYGDASKMDINEVDRAYMQAVRDNIYWINSHYGEIFRTDSVENVQSNYDEFGQFHNDSGDYVVIPRTIPTVTNIVPKGVFNYSIMDVSDKTGTKMDTEENILYRVLRRFELI